MAAVSSAFTVLAGPKLVDDVQRQTVLGVVHDFIPVQADGRNAVGVPAGPELDPTGIAVVGDRAVSGTGGIRRQE